MTSELLYRYYHSIVLRNGSDTVCSLDHLLLMWVLCRCMLTFDLVIINKKGSREEHCHDHPIRPVFKLQVDLTSIYLYSPLGYTTAVNQFAYYHANYKLVYKFTRSMSKCFECYSNITSQWNCNAADIASEHGPLTRYVTLRVAHAPGVSGTFSLAAASKGNRQLAIPACITARVSHTCRDACRDRLPRWRGKRSRHSWCMRNVQFYISGKRPMAWYRNMEKTLSLPMVADIYCMLI